MPYISEPDRVSQFINHCATAKILWIDTEVADFQSNKPRLSLIQVLDDAGERNSDRVLILDVLDRSELINEFIDKIMVNGAIEKVFHHARYDCRFLGKSQVQNVTCTLEMAQKIPYYILPVTNYQLATLAEQLCHFSGIDKTLQVSDWGQRPLSDEQFKYAKMDVVYLACVHHHLLQLVNNLPSNPATEDIAALTFRYRQIEHRWKALDTELKHLKERLKQAMTAQMVSDTDGFQLSIQERKYKKVAFNDLVKAVREAKIDLNFPIRLTQELQKQMTDIIDKLSIEEEVEKVLQLRISEVEDEDIPF